MFPTLYQKYFKANFLSGRPLVPPHTHNGIDNLPVASSGGGGTPGGNDTEVQYNNAGAFAGDSNLVYDQSTATLGVANISDIGSAGMNIEPDGDLILKSVSQSVIIQAPATNKGVAIQAYQDISLQTSHRDITLISNRDVVIQAVTGTVVIQAQGTASDMVFQANDAFIFEISGPPKIIMTSTGMIIFDTGTPSTFGSGGVLYSSAGALHWLGSSGTDTIIAPA